jgi:parallel beta-helix repeat protein
MNQVRRPIFAATLPMSVAIAVVALSSCGGSGSSGGSAQLGAAVSSENTGPVAAPAAVFGTPANNTVSANTGAGTASATPGQAAPGSGSANAPGSVPGSTPVIPPDMSLPVLSLPATAANNSTIELQCGRTYAGTLQLAGKSNVTVKTTGITSNCGNATITPGQAITGWSRHEGNVYSAPISFNAAQVILDGAPLTLAHWPSRETTWAKPTATTASTLAANLPNADVIGARLAFRANDWAIEERNVTNYAQGALSLSPTGNISFDGYPLSGQPDFYLEGKLWMLDEPGEWAVSNGRLYLWSPDGASPEGRVFAAPASDAIDAQNSSGVTVSDVNLYGGANGINALNAKNLKVVRTRISDSSANGILNSGGSGLYVEDASIVRTRHDAIAIKWGGGGEIIKNSLFVDSGTIGMPTNAHAAVNLIASTGSTISGNTIQRAGYIGIHIAKNAIVTGNVIESACMVLTDCGGIYVNGQLGVALNSQVEGNTIRRTGVTAGTSVAQRLAWGIDMDSTTAVTVRNNTIDGNANGMQLRNATGNTVTGNRFSGSAQAHIQMNDEGGTVTTRGNVINGNRFTSIREETYRMSSPAGTESVGLFATFNDNDYRSSSAIFANFNGMPLDYAGWKARTAQDANSTFAQP